MILHVTYTWRWWIFSKHLHTNVNVFWNRLTPLGGYYYGQSFAIVITTYNNGFPLNNPTHYRLISRRLAGHVTILQWIPKSRPHIESPWKALRLLILLQLIDLTPETAVCWVTSPSVSPFTSPSPPIQHITITQTVTYPYFLTSNSNTVIYLLDTFKLDANKIIKL